MMSDLSDVESELLEKLPKPVGYRVLIAIPEVDETYGSSGIIKSTKDQNHEHILSVMGRVMALGEGACADKDRFPSGAWCETGDYVMFRTNTGTRFKVDGLEYRLMNDDSIEAVVADPREITRA